MGSSREYRPLSEMKPACKSMVRDVEKSGNASLESAERQEAARKLHKHYADLLQRYLALGSESVLLDAYSLGRDAVQAGLNLVGAADLHNQALRSTLIEQGETGEFERVLTAANAVYVEFISPFEMSYRGYRQASAAMKHVNEMLEDEIRRIAQSLHDEAGQFLACVHIALYDIGRQVSPEIKARIDETQEMLDHLESELRLLSHELRPRILEESGLNDAVAFLARAVSLRTGLDVKISIDAAARPPGVIETTLYRCVQELLNNVSRHAEAGHATVRISRQNGSFCCEVQDDGKGFDPRDAFIHNGGDRLGLMGMLERISALDGNIAIESSPGNGARIRIEIPEQQEPSLRAEGIY